MLSFPPLINQNVSDTAKQLEKCSRFFFFLIIIARLKLFGVLQEKNPDVLEKMIAVEGDVGALGLGLTSDVLEQLKDVSVIFHSAASVRFDDILKSAIILNTRGTHEVIKLALTLNNLASFVHVSTTYCYPDQRFIDEKVNKKRDKSTNKVSPLSVKFFSDLSGKWRLETCY
jgi:thioester reductase-like protein